MDSINRNQDEPNFEHLSGQDAVERIREIVEDAGTCFFCTSGTGGLSSGARPMAVRKVDDDGNLWFLSASDSHKNAEIARDPRVRLYFQESKHSGFLWVDGRASILLDPKVIDELWQPLLKVWFTEGRDDPRITALKVEPTGGYYWDTRHGALVAGVKMLIGAASGRTLDDSVEGRVQP